MKLRIDVVGVAISLATLVAVACSSDPEPPEDVGCGNDLESFRFEHGSVDGHADPFGAKAAKQARAGRVRDASMIRQPADARLKVLVDDYVIANERIAVYIEKEGRPSGYAPFGGEILAVEPVGDDGRPLGVSEYGETLMLFSRQTVKPDKVTVLADGSDGKAAVIRVSGAFANIEFMNVFAALAREEYDFPAAIDYVLEPGSDKLLVRLSFANTRLEEVDMTPLMGLGFLHDFRSKKFAENVGFQVKGDFPWVAFDSGKSGFLFRTLVSPLGSDLSVSGFELFRTKDLKANACETKSVDYVEVIGGAPGIDGVLEAKRRAFGEPAWREVKGTLKEPDGTYIVGAYVHAQTPDGKYLTRALTDDTGSFVIHVPPGAVTLTPTAKGWAIPAATALPDGAATIDLTLPQRATIEVNAKEAGTNEPLPVRVQIIPETPLAEAPASFGIQGENDGRIWQDFAITGTSRLPVPPGKHRVVVSHGYEYEISDTTVVAEAGKTSLVPVTLEHSVDSTGVMCGDFHIHSNFSPDSDDDVEEKVRGAIADGLDIACSSEHEWIIDFQPVIQKLGMTKWAFGMSSEELTTFAWGHFGVIPIYPRAELPNNGAVNWVGKKPAEIFQQVGELPEKPLLVVNHPMGAGFQGYFNASGFDRKTITGIPDLFSDNFGAIEITTGRDFDSSRESVGLAWFGLLDSGRNTWGVGSSDTHSWRSSPTGYPRSCLPFGHDDPTRLTPEAVRDALKSGNIVVSGGLTMTVAGPGGIPPGAKSTPGEYVVVVQTPSWITAQELEVIVDGVTTETRPLTPIAGPGPGKRYEVKVNVAATTTKPRHYVIFHARGANDLSPLHPREKPFALSNPIFF